MIRDREPDSAGLYHNGIHRVLPGVRVAKSVRLGSADGARTGNVDVALINEGQRFDDGHGDPVEMLREGCRMFEGSTGQRPRALLMAAAIVSRVIENIRGKIEHAERMLGIGRQAEGKFPTGWPWVLRQGRPSREEKRLRDGLPGWRSALKGMTEDPANYAGVTIVQPRVVSLSALHQVIEPAESPVYPLEQLRIMPSCEESTREELGLSRRTGKNRYQRRRGKTWAKGVA